MKYILFPFIAFSISSCALPTTELQLLSKNNVKEACLTYPAEEVISKITPKLYSCYGSGVVGSVYISGGVYEKFTPYRIEESSNGSDSRTFNIITEHKYYGFRLNIEKTEEQSCPTKVTSHTLNIMWNRHVTHVLKWLDDPSLECIGT